MGLVAGVLAKMITPQKEKGGYISSAIIGLLGAFIGNSLGLSAIFGSGLIGSLIVATLGAVILLFIYHKFLADKLNLPI